MTRQLLLIPILCLLLWTVSNSSAHAQIVLEQKAKAVWLYHFGRYTTWPENAVPNSEGKLIIGLVGPNPFGRFLDALQGQPVGDRKVEIRKFETVADYQPCHLVFISPLISNGAEPTATQRLNNLLKVRNTRVLIVSDTPGMATSGAMINYSVNAAGFLDLEINRGELAKEKLKLDPQVLVLKNVRFVP
ncbi:MAG: YfiR family protein [Planctomycetota bacterium]|nr:YfiR family protein [Planctomycetota bacterium]